MLAEERRQELRVSESAWMILFLPTEPGLCHRGRESCVEHPVWVCMCVRVCGGEVQDSSVKGKPRTGLCWALMLPRFRGN